MATDQHIFFAIIVRVCLLIYPVMPFGFLAVIAFGYCKVSCKKPLCTKFLHGNKLSFPGDVCLSLIAKSYGKSIFSIKMHCQIIFQRGFAILHSVNV